MTDNADDRVHLDLPRKLDTASASKLRSSLKEAVGQNIVLNASNVETLGGHCLELLLDAHHHWNTSGHTIHITDPAPAMIRDLECLGATIDAIRTGE